MSIAIMEKKVRGKYHMEASNGFIQITVMELANGSFNAQMKFKKRGNVFLTVTLTHSQLVDYLKEGIKDTTYSASGSMYGVSNESVIHLYNMDLDVTKREMSAYIAMQQSLNQILNKFEGMQYQIS